jgi:hypothetical protein
VPGGAYILPLGGRIDAYTHSHDDSSGERGRGKAYKRASKAQKEMIPLIPILTPASNTKTRQNSQLQPKPIQRIIEKTIIIFIQFE